jgi:hypothetical protein
MFNGLAMELGILKDRDHTFISFFMINLAPLFVYESEILYYKKDWPDEAYFISRGMANYVYGERKIPYRTYTRGGNFGEIEIL